MFHRQKHVSKVDSFGLNSTKQNLVDYINYVVLGVDVNQPREG
ncbi:hypothetical protein [Photobacterium sp. DNB22_13_2]